MNVLFRKFPKSNIEMRKRIFSAFAMPHFIWLFPMWFIFTDKQQRRIEHVYVSGLRYIYSLSKWDDITTLTLSKERSLLDQIYFYWIKFYTHLADSPDALCLRQSYRAFEIVTSSNSEWFKHLGYKRRNRFLIRLRIRAQHSLHDWFDFRNIHRNQVCWYATNTKDILLFVYKFFLRSTHD